LRRSISAGSCAAVAVCALLFALPASRAQDSAPEKSLPTAQQVMERFVAAQGGHDAIFRHRSMTVHAKLMLQPQNLSFDQVSWFKDGKVLQESTYPDGSRDRTGFDGAVAWEIDPRNVPSIAKSDMIESIRRDADMHYFGHVLDYFKSIDVVEVTQFAGHTCYHLKGVNKWGIQNEHFYDTTSGLLVGYRFDSSWRGGPGEEHEVFSDYKNFDGWLMPTSDVQSNAKGSAATTTLSVSFDDLPDSMFASPEPIKALVAKRGTR